MRARISTRPFAAARRANGGADRSEIYHGGSERGTSGPARTRKSGGRREERESHVIGGPAGTRRRDRVAARGDRGGPAPPGGRRGSDRRRGRPPRLRDGRADGLSAVAAGGRAADLDRRGLAAAGLLPPAGHQGGGAWRRHVAFGRRAARRGRGGGRRQPHEPGARDRLHEPHRPRRGRHHQPRHQRHRQGRATSSTLPTLRASSPARSPATSA